MRAALWGALVLVPGVAAALYVARPSSSLPADLGGTLVFVSDRSGLDSLYVRDLKSGVERQLTHLPWPVREPSVSPDGQEVAFSMGGRIGVASLATGLLRILTLGVEWRDASPSWKPDGKALVISSRRAGDSNADIHLLLLAGPQDPTRFPLTQTPGLDETAPVFGPDGTFIVFVREDNLFRLDLGDSRTRRLTGGFRKFRCPRFLASGRLLCLWSEDKRYGLDVMDPTGKSRETLSQGTVHYRSVAPSPDGRFLAATFTFDLRFHPSDALKIRQTEEVRLMDASGQALGPLVRSWRFANHSPDWGR